MALVNNIKELVRVGSVPVGHSVTISCKLTVTPLVFQPAGETWWEAKTKGMGQSSGSDCARYCTFQKEQLLVCIHVVAGLESGNVFFL